jgi:hypothetical protein
MRYFGTVIASVLGLAVLVGCASSETTQRQSYAAQERISRPGRIIVYDIRATPSDVPATAAITGSYSQRQSPQTAEEIQRGRQLGARVAANLVRKILDMGMPAERAGHGPPPQLGDALITGQFISIDEGDRAKRVFIGFGKGSAKLQTHIEGYLVTSAGHRLLGSRQVDTAGGKAPGLVVSGVMTAATGSPVGLLVNSVLTVKGEKKEGSETLEGAARRTADEIAKELKTIFRRQGWI